jgi:hypothetical protein
MVNDHARIIRDRRASVSGGEGNAQTPIGDKVDRDIFVLCPAQQNDSPKVADEARDAVGIE